MQRTGTLLDYRTHAKEAHWATQGGLFYVIGRDDWYVMGDDGQPVSYPTQDAAQAHADRINAGQ